MEFWKMVAIVIILIPITVVIVVSGAPRFIIKAPITTKPRKLAACLPLGMPCMKSKDLCCMLIYQKTYMRLDSVATTCFMFGKGVCQVNQSIDNFEEYSKLVKQLNATNLQELKNKYWSSIPVAYTCPEKVTIEFKTG